MAVAVVSGVTFRGGYGLPESHQQEADDSVAAAKEDDRIQLVPDFGQLNEVFALVGRYYICC